MIRLWAVLVLFLLLPVAAQAQSLERDVDRWLSWTTKDTGDYQSLAPFITKYKDWPAINKLRARAEMTMPSLPEAQVVQWFDANEPQTTGGAIRYIAALQAAGQSAKAQKIAREWWHTASMNREDQQQFFQRYNALLTRDDHLRRLDTTLFGGAYTNGRAIAAILGGGYPALAEARIALSMDTGGVEGKIAAVPSSLQNDPGLLYERLRYRRMKGLDSGAIEILARAPAPDKINNLPDWWAERHIIIRRLMENNQYKQAYELAAAHGQKEGLSYAQAEWVAGFLALRKTNQAWPAFEHFEKLYHNTTSPISRSRGAYWAGRASEKLGYKDIANQWYAKASEYNTTFYGQMAASALGQPNKPINIARMTSNRAAMDNQPMVRAAKYLARAGYRNEASSFLLRQDAITERAEDFAALSAIAESMGQEHIAIKIASNAQTKHGIVLPALFPSIAGKLGGVRDVEPALVHGLIRQESRFDRYAISSAGARGLMQVMPATAKETARKLGLSHQTDWLTERPDHNIRIGSTYIAQMLGSYSNDYVLALASYNAGPGRVRQWLAENGDPRSGSVDLIDWIEEIPIYETRNYVQRVMEGVYVYRQVLGESERQRTPLLHVAFHE